MNEQTSVKIANMHLERLRLEYPDMSFNNIMECIASEENNMKRYVTNDIQNKDISVFFCTMKKKFPGISHKEIIDKCIKCMEISPPDTK